MALLLSLVVAAALFERAAPPRGLSAMLAIPHLAFAIGLSFLIAPSGLVARLLALPLHWLIPPQWISVHDPLGLGLSFALACKETAFLLFAATGLLARADLRHSLEGQAQAARALGHGSLSIWLRIFLPQLLPQLRWPVAIVFIYACSVVDMALVLGPTQPPTLALVSWADITHADAANTARGSAGALFLALACGLCLAAMALAIRAARPGFMAWATRGPARGPFPVWLGLACWRGLQLVFLAIIALLPLLSLAPLWPFPDLAPPQWSLSEWSRALVPPHALVNSLAFGLASALAGLALLLCWLESAAETHDRWLSALCLAVLGLPALLIGLGQYQLFLRLGLVASLPGLFLVHFISATAYMFVLLAGPYRRFDPRWREASAGLLATRARFFWQVKWPLLKAPLSAAFAVGFAVAFGQYVPAQLVSAGRYTTLPIEAVTQTAGTNRALTAAYAVMLMLPPLLAFALAGWAGRNRWAA
jgi:putative thiamine transport system permease protein